MNYNKWFYEYNKYLKTRSGNYNDTNWSNYNERFKALYDMSSSLVDDQPFGVIANNTGFDKLIDLMGRSNYTFDDINESLIQTYEYSLQNAMSRNLVNTHAVIFSASMYNKKNVTAEAFSGYYIIDAPFDQLHFGERDEFIRQRLQKIHFKAYNNYVDIKEFNNSNEIKDILDFTLICCANGKISNDCKVAISDKGFKFKISWKYSYDATFIVYKLDKCDFISCTISPNDVKSAIPYDTLGLDKTRLINRNCILNIYDPDSNFDSVPNFGYFTDAGLIINGLQSYTVNMFGRSNSRNAVINIFIPKFIKEVPDLYPAVNIYDLIDSRIVMDERKELIKDVNSNKIVSSINAIPGDVSICTPPICIDRDTSSSFKAILDATTIKNSLLSYESAIQEVGNAIHSNDINRIANSIDVIRNTVRFNVNMLFVKYNQFAILTSLVDAKHISLFKKFIDNITKLCNVTSYTPQTMQQVTFDELYDSNYRIFVNSVCNIFNDDKLSIFRSIGNIYHDTYFNNIDPHSILRPISEECIIALKYDKDEDCWVFNTPEIRHFNGIGNTFYINNKLNGTEIFKFFVLYSNSESPSENHIDNFEEETIFDFDKFYTEIEKYVGYIRYWDAENKLMKLSKILFNKYNDDTCMDVLSKMLKHKFDPDIVFDYASEMSYADANITSDMVDEYTDVSERGPFSVNFLFYTLSLMNDNPDKLQSYLYRRLVENKYNNRYLDMNIKSITDGKKTIPVSYSQYTVSPTMISADGNPSSDTISAYYGLPLYVNNGSVSSLDMYRNTFNVINPETEFPLIDYNGIDDEYYLKYTDDLSTYHGLVISYKDTIKYAQLIAEYLRAIYDLQSIVLTNYSITYNQTSALNSFLDKSNVIINKLVDLMDTYHIADISGIANTSEIHDMLLNYNDFVDKVTNIIDKIRRTNTTIPGGVRPVLKLVSEAILPMMKQVYISNGFTDEGKMRARALYIHLKKINNPMNCYSFKKWLLGIDRTTLGNLDSMVSYNTDPGNVYSKTLFKDLNTELSTYINYVAIQESTVTGRTLIDDIDYYYKELNSGDIKTAFISPLIDYVNNVITNLIFPLYKIASIDISPIGVVGSKPKYCVITIDSEDHINDPVTHYGVQRTELLAQPIFSSAASNNHTINSLSLITDYCFFNGDTLTGCDMKILDESGNTLLTTTVDINFVQISTTADDINTFEKIINCNTTVFDFDNHHESFEIYGDKIINKKHADMNYELLCGNAFETLPHETEYILTPNTWAEKSVDRVFVENQTINAFADMEFSHRSSNGVYFKPSYVLHLTPSVDGSIDSVYGKFFEGETVYLSTYDNDHIFPVKITKVDHSTNKGFIEAEVDNWNSSWFKLDDNEKISEYLVDDIKCKVIDDNVRNFLNEYNNTSYENFYTPSVVNDPDADMYTLPGDPIYVNSNQDYVHTRLDWIFNDTIENRFIGEDHKRYNFTYITNGFITDPENDVIKIHMINFDYDDRNIVEKYPILRSEPNDHDIWEAEIAKFKSVIEELEAKEVMLNTRLESHIADFVAATTDFEKQRLSDYIEIDSINIDSCREDIKRMERMIFQLESPTTWFNVRSYDATLVYIDNGRADTFSPAYVSNIRDVLYTKDLEVWLYDLDNKQWLDPSTYYFTLEMVDNVQIDNAEDYSTNKVLYSMCIVPSTGFVASHNILVYFAYNKSDVYDDIEMNDNECCVRFKPVLSISKPVSDYDPYSHIYIREHFDGYEKYKIDAGDDLIVNRIKRNGKYIDPPQFRLCDISIDIEGFVYPYTRITKLFVKEPFIGLTTTRTFNELTYNAVVRSNIDNFVDGTTVNLICISNNNRSSYDGHISSVMFTGVISKNASDNQIITITNSTLSNDFIPSGSFVCTVFGDEKYPCTGGVIEIFVNTNTVSAYGNDGWYEVPVDYMRYRELPETFKIETDLSINSDAYIILENKYVDDYTDTISSDNSGLYNMNEYYYDDLHHHRLPISDTRVGDYKSRLVVDTTVNENVKLVKSTYLGICRYSLNKIPEEGLIDLTGYIPTPLSRNRYEFWVNGRCLKDDNFIILSPTIIQLKNLKSLKHFECIELIDDIDSDSELFKNGTVYTDINGNTYSNYKLAMLSNSKISNQRIAYIFNVNNTNGLHSYTKNIIPHPNNMDIEEDILDGVTFNDASTDYNKLTNIPSINGVTIYHPTLFDLGIREVDNSLIIKDLDKVWKYEVLLNPLFDKTHITAKIDSSIIIRKIMSDTWNGMTIEPGSFEVVVNSSNKKFITLYVSTASNGNIDDVNKTLKIIPFISSGDHILIDKSFEGKWLCATDKDIQSTQIK